MSPTCTQVLYVTEGADDRLALIQGLSHALQIGPYLSNLTLASKAFGLTACKKSTGRFDPANRRTLPQSTCYSRVRYVVALVTSNAIAFGYFSDPTCDSLRSPLHLQVKN